MLSPDFCDLVTQILVICSFWLICDDWVPQYQFVLDICSGDRKSWKSQITNATMRNRVTWIVRHEQCISMNRYPSLFAGECNGICFSALILFKQIITGDVPFQGTSYMFTWHTRDKCVSFAPSWQYMVDVWSAPLSTGVDFSSAENNEGGDCSWEFTTKSQLHSTSCAYEHSHKP